MEERSVTHILAVGLEGRLEHALVVGHRQPTSTEKHGVSKTTKREAINNNLLEDGSGLAVVRSRVRDHHVLQHELNAHLAPFFVLNEAPVCVLLGYSFLEECFNAPAIIHNKLESEMMIVYVIICNGQKGHIVWAYAYLG